MTTVYRFRMRSAWFIRAFSCLPVIFAVYSVLNANNASASLKDLLANSGALILVIFPLWAWWITSIHIRLTDTELIIQGVFRRRIPLERIESCRHAPKLNGETLTERISATGRSWGRTRIWGRVDLVLLQVGSSTIGLDLEKPSDFITDLAGRLKKYRQPQSGAITE